MDSVICYACNGNGIKIKKKTNLICKACNGTGNIIRSKRKNEDGSYRKKRIEKSYPNYKSIGPDPLGQRDRINLEIRDDEELCYLVGNWKIYQRLDRHRYSTDDLVTSFIACQHATNFFLYDSNDSSSSFSILDIGCGLGSVLLSNSWQLPFAKCYGVEVQKDRYDLACRSIEYNIGSYPLEQQRIKILNLDLRQELLELNQEMSSGFDMITGTPPYFPMLTGAAPSNIESTGCLFELRGGVEEYSLAASKLLRCPSSLSSSLSSSCEKASFFVMCNTSLTSARVYAGCHTSNTSVIKRIDVVPKQGKPVLFCVFVIVLNEWLTAPSTSSLFPILKEYSPPKNISIDIITSDYRTNTSVRGEIIETLTVRDANNNHTPEYQHLLESLGKPHSGNKEVYN